VSELLLFNTNSAIFQLYHGETGQENGDLLIQVTAWAGLTKSKYLIKIIISENPTKWDTSIIKLEDVVCKTSMINSDLSKMTSAADICRLYRPVFIRYSELFYSNTVF
jgi:hypothetical protein